MNKLKLGVGLADIVLGAGIVNNEFKSGNLTGREKLYHNTKEENIESIKRNGILSERAADKDNLTQSTLGNFLNEEDMAGLTYLGRQRRVANLVGVGAKWADKNKASRETLTLNAPIWKMQTVDNPELKGAKSGAEYRKILADRLKERTENKYGDSIKGSVLKPINSARGLVSADISYDLIGPDGTYVVKGDISPEYIKDSNKYKPTSKEEIKEFAENNPVRFKQGLITAGLGTGLAATGTGLVAKALLKRAGYTDEEIEKQAASFDARRKKQYWQMLKKLYGGTDEAMEAIRRTGDTGIYHGTAKRNINSIMKDGLISGNVRGEGVQAHGKGIYFGSPEKAKGYAELTTNGSVLRFKKPSEFSSLDSSLYPNTRKVFFRDPAFEMSTGAKKNPRRMTQEEKENAFFGSKYKTDPPGFFTDIQMHVKADRIDPHLLYKDTEKVKEDLVKNTRISKPSYIVGGGIAAAPIIAGLGYKAYQDKKTASAINEEIEKTAGVGKGILGAALLSQSPDLILGKKTMYHGTSNENWENIKKEGFKTNYGGTGVSAINDKLKDNSKGNIHLTALRPVANYHAAMGAMPEKFKVTNRRLDLKKQVEDIVRNKGSVSEAIELEELRNKLYWPGKAEFVRGHFLPLGNRAKMVKVKMPYNKYQAMDIDEDLTWNKTIKDITGSNGVVSKNIAAKTYEDVPIEDIVDSNSSLSDKMNNTVSNLPNYIKENPIRFGTGLGTAGIGSKLLLDFIRRR